LGEHFGFIDETLNPDLADITKHYLVPGYAFLVAYLGPTLVGTGALITESEGIGRIVRVSTSHTHRRKGVAKAIMRHLMDIARQRSYRYLLLSTNIDWEDAIGLYTHLGFREDARTTTGVRMILEVSSFDG
jgi:ribosomal protein S18 acetylase RimI-like enzyme